MNRCSVYVCQSHPLVVEGIRAVLDRSGDFQLVGEARSISGAREEISSLRPRLVVLDSEIGWREIQRFQADLSQQFPDTMTVVLGSDLTGEDRYRAIRSGVRGLYRQTLPASALLECLREVAKGNLWVDGDAADSWAASQNATGGVRLTPREKDIVRRVARGLKNREIGAELAITTGTVKVHLMHVFEKTRVKDRYELAMQANALLGD